MVITIAREVKFSNPKYEHLRVVETTLPCTSEKIMNGKLVCRGAGDSHLPRSMRARSPHVLPPVGGSPANGRAPEVREPTGTVLRSWIAADATHLHHTIFIKDGKLGLPGCR